TKKGHVVRFLRGGDKVKITIMFRGREQSRPELGFNLLRRLAEDVSDDGVVEQSPKQEGRNMHMVLSPTRKKSDARADHEVERARKQAERQAEAAAEKAEEARLREASKKETKPKKKRGPADNMDPDIDV
ncbi:MAG: translation initiation factor IF-3, partial [Propionibacterium freudenreichii]